MLTYYIQNDQTRKSPFVKHQWILPAVCKNLTRNGIFISPQNISSYKLKKSKRKEGDLQWRNLANSPNQIITDNISNIGTPQNHVPPGKMKKEEFSIPSVTCPKQNTTTTKQTKNQFHLIKKYRANPNRKTF